MDQRTEEWFAVRRGKATASRIADIVARTKSGWGASRANYAATLIAERLTGTVLPSYVNAAMQFGIDTEPEARAAYVFMTDQVVTEVGFVDHPTIPMAGASPDGLCGDRGLVEIKCPQTAAHIDTLLNNSVDSRYVLQMQWQMACTGREWCDFVSYDPRMPPSMQLFVERRVRDDKKIAELEREVSVFLKEIDDTIAKLRGRYETRDAA